MDDVVVAQLTPSDLQAVVAIHKKAFPDSAITALGPGAVQRYYRWLLDGPHDARLMVARRNSRVIGFCAAGVFRGALSGFLRANRGYLLRHIATHPWLAFSPLVRQRVRRALEVTIRFAGAGRRPTPRAKPGSEPFGILSIATDPEVRGLGAGRALMLEAVERARLLGFTRMVLTVHPSNAGAIRFYEQLGWSKTNEFTMARELLGASDSV